MTPSIASKVIEALVDNFPDFPVDAEVSDKVLEACHEARRLLSTCTAWPRWEELEYRITNAPDGKSLLPDYDWTAQLWVATNIRAFQRRIRSGQIPLADIVPTAQFMVQCAPHPSAGAANRSSQRSRSPLPRRGSSSSKQHALGVEPRMSHRQEQLYNRTQVQLRRKWGWQE
ncbi:hypothetical protein JCM10207_000890 [Rhodosporidiobolus poonsookiae]